MFNKVKNFFRSIYDWGRYIVTGDDNWIDLYLAGELEPENLSVGATIEPVAKHWGLFIDGELTKEYSRKADAKRGAARLGYDNPSILVD